MMKWEGYMPPMLNEPFGGFTTSVILWERSKPEWLGDSLLNDGVFAESVSCLALPAADKTK